MFRAITRTAARRPWTVVIIASAITLGCLAASARIEVRTAFKDTMHPSDPAVKMQTYMEENFPATSAVLIAVEALDRDRMISVASQLRDRFANNKDLVRAVYLEQPVDWFMRHGLLYMRPDQLRLFGQQLASYEQTLRKLFADPSALGILSAAAEYAERQTPRGGYMSLMTSRAMAGAPSLPFGGGSTGSPPSLADMQLPPSDSVARESVAVMSQALSLFADVLEQGPRFTAARFGKRMNKLRELDFERLGGMPDRYRISPDGTMLLFEVVSQENINKLEKAEPFLDFLQKVIDDIELANPDVKVSLTGMPAVFKQESEALLGNFVLITILAFVGILAVFIIGFQRIALPSLAGIPLMMGVSWSFGFQAIRGSMNLFDLIFPVLLLGLGIDFAIHIIAGFSERRSAGDEPETALANMFKKIGPGLITGACTTAAAFFALLAASFYGLRSMGLTAGVGVVMALLSMLWVLPALLILWDRRQTKRGSDLPHVSFEFLNGAGVWLRKHRYATLSGFLVVTIVLAYFVPRVWLDRNPMNTEPKGLPALQAQERVLEKFENSSEMVVFFAKDLKEAEQIRRRAERAVTIGQVVSVSLMLPPPELQKTVAPLIAHIGSTLAAMAPTSPPPARTYSQAEITQMREQLGKIKGVLLDLSVAARILYDDKTNAAFGKLRDLVNRVDLRLNVASAERLRYLDKLISVELGRSLQLFQDMTRTKQIGVDDLPPQITQQLRGNDGTWMVLVRGKGNVWEEKFLNAFVADLKQVHPRMAGMVPTWHRMLNKIMADMGVVILLTLGIVALLVFIDFRSVRGTLLALTPLIVGIVWTVGILGMLNVPFNFNSIMAIPLIVGIGIDDGVHIYHRIREERELPAALEHSGKAVLLTTLTTGIGFGSLMLSVHRGFFSLGMVTTIGLVCCFFVSVFLLPALVAIFDEDTLAEAPRE